MASEIEIADVESENLLDNLEDDDTRETGIVIPNFDTRTVSATPDGDAVIVLNAMKSYQSGHPVLNGLNMTVPCGSIYGLLGSSGCGKTTILSCIVGVQQLDRGKIWIFGKKPGTKSIGVPGRNIGYMPQEISLYHEFSIGETINYFGTLSGMTFSQIKTEKEILSNLIELPADSRRIGTLSGGQQRRVSLTVALLRYPPHPTTANRPQTIDPWTKSTLLEGGIFWTVFPLPSAPFPSVSFVQGSISLWTVDSLITQLISGPELLILDEPTAGVDPVVRQNIWLYLKELVQSKRTTIIITTHYIEECRTADNIGLMRNGRLLEEAPPETLMMDYGTNNLETIILEVSKKDTVQSSLSLNIKVQPPAPTIEIKLKGPPGKMASVLHKPRTGCKDPWSRIAALTLKNFVILYRNPLLLFFVIMFSPMLALLMSETLGSDPRGLTLGVVNNEAAASPTTCKEVVRNPGQCPGTGEKDLLSCHYLNYLENGVLDWKMHDTEAEALAEVYSGKSWGYIMFPSNFSAAMFVRITSGINVNEMTYVGSQFKVKLDESNKQISNFIIITLVDAYRELTSTFFGDCGLNAELGGAALKYKKPIFGKSTTDFREFLVPGAAFTVLFFFPIITSSIRYIKEKKSGVLHRSIVGGVKTWETMVAYSISEFCVLLVQSLLCYAVIIWVLKITILGSDVLILTLFVLAGYGGVSMGLLLGSICKEEIQAAMLAMALFLPNLLLSGILWPLEGLPVGLQYAVRALPCTIPSIAIRSVTSRGWDFYHEDVWPGFAVICGYIVVHFILTVLFHIIFKTY